MGALGYYEWYFFYYKPFISIALSLPVLILPSSALTQEGLKGVFEAALFFGSLQGLKLAKMPLPPEKPVCPLKSTNQWNSLYQHHSEVRGKISSKFLLKEDMADIEIVLEYVTRSREVKQEKGWTREDIDS
jgi:hypothetical protein